MVSLAFVSNESQHSKVVSNTHLMGLIYNSGISKHLDLSNPAIIVLNSLAFHFNTRRKDMFPTQELIASKTNLSTSSIKRGLNELLVKGVIIKTKKSKSSTNLYKFTQKFFELVNLNCTIVQNDPNHEFNLISPCIEHEKNNKRKEQTISKEYSTIKPITIIDDVSSKTIKQDTFLTEYKQLESWGVSGAKFLIRKYGTEKIKNLIEIVKNRNPKNHGAYLRRLLELPDNPIQQTNSVIYSSNALNHIKNISKIKEPRLSKEEIVKKLLQEGKVNEANTLVQMWKLTLT